MTNAVSIAQSGSNNVTFRNRIINGAMAVSQRGAVNIAAGGSFAYTAADRFAMINFWGSGQVNTAISSLAPTGFSNSTSLTVATAAPMSGSTGYVANLWQSIEGFNIADAYSTSITLSFWVRSSIAGTYSVTFVNTSLPNAADGSRIFVANYTINNANTWEQKFVTVDLSTGTAAGTWNTSNGTGLCVVWNLGAESNRKGNGALGSWLTLAGSYPMQSASQTNWISTNGATFYITGVQLEAGSVATPFEFRQYGMELALCQRYFQSGTGLLNAYYTGGNFGGGAVLVGWKVTMRAAPTISSVFTTGVGPTGSPSSLAVTDRCQFWWPTGATQGDYREFTYTASAEL